MTPAEPPASTTPSDSKAPSAPVAPVAVLCADGHVRERAELLAQRLDAPLEFGFEGFADAFSAESGQLYLKVSAHGLSLVRDGMELQPDFAKMAHRVRQGALQRELLVKAARVRGVGRPRAVDATAGLGEDALLLAAAGFEVTLCEADPVIAALLEDVLERSAHDCGLAHITARMHLVAGDGRITLASLSAAPDAAPDVVYLDPMFPGRAKSAAVKKKFQLIHGLERPCDAAEEESLLQAALAARPRKIVVKRPVKGASLAGVKPSHSVVGKAVRYDCIVLPR